MVGVDVEAVVWVASLTIMKHAPGRIPFNPRYSLCLFTLSLWPCFGSSGLNKDRLASQMVRLGSKNYKVSKWGCANHPYLQLRAKLNCEGCISNLIQLKAF